MKKHLFILIVPVFLFACAEDKNPYSLEQMKASAKLAFEENKKCEAGQYDGKRWKSDYCIQARTAFLIHQNEGRISPDGNTVEAD